MKTILFAIAIVASQVSFAGPEERQNNNCFEATSAVPQGMSSTICYEGLSLDTKNIKLYPGSSVVLPSQMEVSFLRENEDEYSFNSQVQIAKVTGTIDETTVELEISGRAAILGEVDEATVQMTAKVFYNNDYWHSEDSHLQQTIKFVRVK